MRDARSIMKGHDMPLHESGEDYLEAILMLSQEHEKVRSVDVADRLGVTKASVSKAMSSLESKGYVEMGKRDVRLTERGLEVAEPRRCGRSRGMSHGTLSLGG